MVSTTNTKGLQSHTIQMLKHFNIHRVATSNDKYVADERERPHLSRVLSTVRRAHVNSLRVSHGYARTCTRSQPIRPSHLTGQSARLSACHAKTTVRLKAFLLTQPRFKPERLNWTSEYRFPVSQIHPWPPLHFDLGGLRHGCELFVEQTSF